MFSSSSLRWRYWHWFWLSLRNSQIFEFTRLGSSQQFCKLSICFWHFEGSLLLSWCNFKHCIKSQYCLWHAKSESHLVVVGVDILVNEKVRLEQAAKFKTCSCHTLDPEKRLETLRGEKSGCVQCHDLYENFILSFRPWRILISQENLANIYFQFNVTDDKVCWLFGKISFRMEISQFLKNHWQQSEVTNRAPSSTSCSSS